MKIQFLLFFILLFHSLVIGQNTWLNTYDPFNSGGFVTDILVCSDGGYVINGDYSGSFGIMGYVMKTDSDGNMIWAHDFAMSSYFWEHDMVETVDGGIVTTGYINPGIGGGVELIKIDPEGYIEWYDILENFRVFCLDNTNDGNIVAVGYIPDEVDNWPTLIKLNQDNEIIWSKSYVFSNYVYGYATSVVQANDEGYLIIGKLSISPSDKDFFVVKTNADGDSLWSRIYGNNGINDECNAVIEVDDDNVLVSGSSDTDITTGILWKLDTDGNTIWFYETPQEIHKSLSKSSDNSIISLSGLGPTNNHINKFNSNYEIIWSQEFNIRSGTSDKTLSTTSEDYIVVAVNPSYDIGIAKLNSEGLITSTEDELQLRELNIFNFPNPFNPSTTINFSIQNASQVELIVYNIKGQKIKTLTHNEYAKGSYSIVWDGVDEAGKSVSSGVFCYKLNINGKTLAIKKCLLLK